MTPSLKYLVCSLIVLSSFSTCTSQKHITYIDEDKPGLTKKLFASGFISKDDAYEFGSVFSKDGKEFYYAVDTDGKAIIKYTEVNNGEWLEPITIISDEQYGFNDPFLSPDEQRLYYISNMPRNDRDTIDDIDIWYSVRKKDNKWSAPINAGPEINTDFNEYYISFTSEGTMYFASNKENAPKRGHDFEIYSSAYMGGEFQRPVKLSNAVNTRAYEADVFIAPDESYIIFCSFRRSGLGEGDLYISFKTKNGEWTEAKNMGEEINSEHHELCPFVTHDGKYLFYTSNKDIYWISTEMFENLKE